MLACCTGLFLVVTFAFSVVFVRDGVGVGSDLLVLPVFVDELTSVFLEPLEQPSMAMANATASVPETTTVAGMLTAQRRRIACMMPPVFLESFESNEMIFAMFVSPPPARRARW